MSCCSPCNGYYSPSSAGSANSGAFNLFVTDKLSITSSDDVYISPSDFKEQMISVYNTEVSDIGSHYTAKIILPQLPAQYQAIAFFKLEFPSADGITIQFIQFLSGNPVIVFFVTDGSGIPAEAQLAFDGQNWTVTNGNWIE